MAYVLSDLISEVQRKVKDPSFDSSLITDYLNDTQDEVLGERMYSFMETTVTPTLNEGDSTYTYPTDLQAILGVVITDPASDDRYMEPDYLEYRKFFQCYPTPDIYEPGWPQAYTDYGRVLYWDRPLDDDYVLTLRYLKRPTELANSTDVPHIPQEFKNILIRGAMAGVEEYRDNYDMGAIHRRKVEKLVEDLTIRYSSRDLRALHKSSPIRVRKV